VRTQIQRWTDANRPRLTAEQVRCLEEMRGFISPDLYRRPTPDPLLAKLKELEARALTLFSPDDLARAVTLEAASYIPRSR
jgi:hypothetical protein